MNLERLHTIWLAARLLPTFPAEDLALSFGDYLAKYGVVDSPVEEPSSTASADELDDLADELERTRLTRSFVNEFPSDGLSMVTADTAYRSARRESMAEGAGFNAVNAASPTTYRPTVCQRCGTEMAPAKTGRPRRFCSVACRVSSHRSRPGRV